MKTVTHSTLTKDETDCVTVTVQELGIFITYQITKICMYFFPDVILVYMQMKISVEMIFNLSVINSR